MRVRDASQPVEDTLDAAPPSGGGPGLRLLGRVLPGDRFTLVTSAVLLVTGVTTGVIAARALEAAGRGQLAAVVSWAGLLLAVCTLGFEDSATRYPDQVRALAVRLRLTAIAALPILVAFLFLIFELTPIGELLDRPVVVVLAACGTLYVAFRIGSGLLLGFEKLFDWNLARLLPAVTYLVAVLIVVSSGESTVDAFALALGVSWVVGLLAVLAGLARSRGPQSKPSGGPPSAPGPRGLLSFSLRAHVANLSAIANFRLDQAVLFFLVTASQLGQYAVAMTAIIAPSVFLQAQNYVAYSRLCRVAEAPTFKQTLRSERRRMLALSAAIYGAVGVVSPFLVPVLFGQEYSEGGWLVALLAPGAILLYLSRVLQSALKASGRPGTAAIAECVAVSIAIGLLPILVSLWGLVGACVAAAVGYAVACTFEAVVLAGRGPLLRGRARA